jgi:hypothetical protein
MNFMEEKMAKAGVKLDVPIASATGYFVQSINRLLDSDKAAELDSETYDAILEINEALDKFENFLLTKRSRWFFKDRVVMFNGYDLG